MYLCIVGFRDLIHGIVQFRCNDHIIIQTFRSASRQHPTHTVYFVITKFNEVLCVL